MGAPWADAGCGPAVISLFAGLTWRVSLCHLTWWGPLVMLYTLLIGANETVPGPLAMRNALFTVG